MTVGRHRAPDPPRWPVSHRAIAGGVGILLLASSVALLADASAPRVAVASAVAPTISLPERSEPVARPGRYARPVLPTIAPSSVPHYEPETIQVSRPRPEPAPSRSGSAVPTVAPAPSSTPEPAPSSTPEPEPAPTPTPTETPEPIEDIIEDVIPPTSTEEPTP